MHLELGEGLSCRVLIVDVGALENVFLFSVEQVLELALKGRVLQLILDDVHQVQLKF